MLKMIKYIWEQFVMICVITMTAGMIWFLGCINKTLLDMAYVEYPSLVILTLFGYGSCFIVGYLSGKKGIKNDID